MTIESKHYHCKSNWGKNVLSLGDRVKLPEQSWNWRKNSSGWCHSREKREEILSLVLHHQPLIFTLNFTSSSNSTSTLSPFFISHCSSLFLFSTPKRLQASIIKCSDIRAIFVRNSVGKNVKGHKISGESSKSNQGAASGYKYQKHGKNRKAD